MDRGRKKGEEMLRNLKVAGHQGRFRTLMGGSTCIWDCSKDVKRDGYRVILF